MSEPKTYRATRTITYESSDLDDLRDQIERSLPDGESRFRYKGQITITTDLGDLPAGVVPGSLRHRNGLTRHYMPGDQIMGADRDGRTCVLRDKDGNAVLYKQNFTAALPKFGGDTRAYTVLGGDPPHRDGFPGSVLLAHLGSTESERYYPSVLGLSWVPEPTPEAPEGVKE